MRKINNMKTLDELSEIFLAVMAAYDADFADMDMDEAMSEGIHDLASLKAFEGTDIEFLAEDDAGDGNYLWIAFKYIPTGQCFGFSGTYSSWDGPDDMSFTMLEPTTVIQYYPKS